MSNLTTRVEGLEPSFTKMSEGHKAVKFKEECHFALQALTSNSFLGKIASSNPASLESAILNVAAIGITLNPASKMAYLIPRKGVVCLDISYMGLCHLAMISGSIKFVQAEIIHEKDVFKKTGVSSEPIHEADYFGDRGNIVGAYVVAKTSDGEYLTDVMTLTEINGIRDRSESFKRNSGPWISDYTEMAKKTVIKRASKLWPKVSPRLTNAIDTVNKHEGIDFEEETKEQKRSRVVAESADEDLRKQIELADKRTDEQRDTQSLTYKFDSKPPKFAFKHLVEIPIEELGKYYDTFLKDKPVSNEAWLEAKEAIEFALNNEEEILELQSA